MYKSKLIWETAKLKMYSISDKTELSLAFVENGIPAGFPSPANDFLDAAIDLNKHLIRNPSTTFVAIADGHSMRKAGIQNRDLLIIDRSIEPKHEMVAVCSIDGEFTLKRLLIKDKELLLKPENDAFENITITEFNDFEIWGVLTYSITCHLP